MNVKELIEILQRADQELPVCVFQDGGPDEVGQLDVYEGRYIIDSPKMAVLFRTGVYVGIGHPGDFEETESEDDCRLVQELT